MNFVDEFLSTKFQQVYSIPIRFSNRKLQVDDEQKFTFRDPLQAILYKLIRNQAIRSTLNTKYRNTVLCKVCYQFCQLYLN